MSVLKRIRLFARDYLQEFGCAWSIARMRDCDRMGGHLWTEAKQDGFMGWHRECTRCHCSETLPTTNYTAATNTTNYTIYR